MNLSDEIVGALTGSLIGLIITGVVFLVWKLSTMHANHENLTERVNKIEVDFKDQISRIENKLDMILDKLLDK